MSQVLIVTTIGMEFALLNSSARCRVGHNINSRNL